MVIFLPRKYFLFPFILAACLIPSSQRIILAGLDFTPLRFCVLFGVLRMMSRGETVSLKFNTIDKLIFLWSISGAIVYVIQWNTFTAVVYKSGVLFDCLGLYWIFRQTIRSWSILDLVIKILAIFSFISAAIMLYEWLNQTSLFAFLGRDLSYYHHGRFRCAGPFTHFIIMGLFWATITPLLIPYVVIKRQTIFHLAAVISCVICVLCSSSSTSYMALIAIAVSFSIYKFRCHGKYLFWASFIVLCGLQLVMKAPVWHLISRVNIFSGSTGWHRYNLIDQTISHFDEWFLIGCQGVAHWGIHAGDITNQFILEGVRGGLVTLVIFIILIYHLVKIPCLLSLKTQSKYVKWLSWGVCVSVLGHIVSFFGVSYFGQIMMLLYLIFAIVGFFEDNLKECNRGKGRACNPPSLTY
jgi:hypothetical protein